MLSAIIGTLLVALPMTVLADPLSKVLPGAELRGEATFRYVGFTIYDARLFTIGAAPLNWSQDFALELTYRRKLSQYDLVEATLREMNRMGKALPIRAKLESCYQAVGRGDTYLAVTQGPDVITFWRNDRPARTLRFAGIKTRFMSVFLGDNTQSPRFTRDLRGK